ncbi:cytidine deaminase [Paeniglutamicibacter sp. ABSL32-1]|uniref:cytidine deaminase n=1 Tax=Paeniglutamicibacter quisquiliarum TaxID=2849498 RepID=UPI001C2D9C8F|nr:cytidine deaminase [Paeniglutamicibacter quisquiliarum]MBV1780511.1 cytidine deaminase [Paeniglutamicibacter quisquiliarum]
MDPNQKLVEAAIEQLRTRWPGARDSVAAAAVVLEDGEILTSVSFDNFNAAATLCAETGAVAQAYTLGKRVVASACVTGGTAEGTYQVLAPCGICQERLAVWGPGVLAAVPGSAGGAEWEMRTLRELNPYYWATSFTSQGQWPSTAEHGE